MQTSNTFCKSDAFDDMSAREFLDRNSENMQKRNQFSATIWPYFFKNVFFFSTATVLISLMTFMFGNIVTGICLKQAKLHLKK